MEPPPPPLACAACLGDDAPASPLGACGHALCADCGASALRVGLEELATAGVALPPSGAAVAAAAPANKTAGNDNDDDDDDGDGDAGGASALPGLLCPLCLPSPAARRGYAAAFAASRRLSLYT